MNRVFDSARKNQGFKDQSHLDRFFAYYDHLKGCPDCGNPGKPVPLDDGMQPTLTQCGKAIRLFEAIDHV